MRKRDKLTQLFRPAAGVAPPARPKTPQQSISTATQVVGPSVPSSTSGSVANTSATNITDNPALQEALKRQISAVPEAEKIAFVQASKDVNAEDLLGKVAALDAEHKQESHFRSQAENLSRFLAILDRFVSAITIVAQANPDVSSIVIGAFRLVLDVASGFVGFFARFCEMLGRFEDFIAPMSQYTTISAQQMVICNALASVYGDLLDFCRKARAVFVDEKGGKRQWTSWRLFWRLQWIPFESEFGAIASSLQHHLSVLSHCAQGLALGATLESTVKERERRQRESANERESFLNWISSIPFETVHANLYARKHPGTGGWLLQTSQFRNWFHSGESALLWCHGKPGAGKSILASNVLEFITTERALRDGVGICFAYYDYRNAEFGDITKIITALVKQLCRKREAIPGGFLKVKSDAMDPSQLGNIDSFVAIAQEFHDELFIVLDALDECPKSSRPALLGFLTEISQKLTHAKIFVTSRRAMDIAQVLDNLTTPIIQVEAWSVKDDIISYVKSETQKLRQGHHGRKFYIKDDRLEDKVVQTLTEQADGMFLWVNLQLSALCTISECQKDREVEKALQMLPSGLDSTYGRVLDQITSQTEYMRTLALKAFQWVLYASRSLTSDELREAIISEEFQKSSSPPERDTMPVILEACANLLVEEHVGRFDDPPIVRLVHYSAQEYLVGSSPNSASGPLMQNIQSPERAHSALAMACISYIQANLEVSFAYRNQGVVEKHLKSFPLLWYSAHSFDFHLYYCGNLSTSLTQFVMAFMKNSTSHSVSGVLRLRSIHHRSGFPYEPNVYEDFNEPNREVDFSNLVFASRLYDIEGLRDQWEGLRPPKFALHGASSSGLSHAVYRLLALGVDVNESNEAGVTPIYYAARNGDLETVLALFSCKVNVNAQGGQYGNALQVASYKSPETVVRLLIEKGADINAQGGLLHNALHAATFRGDEAIVGLLLENGADGNSPGGDHGTALGHACFVGNPRIVQLLLDSGADVNGQAGYFGYPLQIAAKMDNLGSYVLHHISDADLIRHFWIESYKAVVQLLLENGADVNAQGGHCGNALQAAAAASDDVNNQVVRLLLDWGAEVNAQGGAWGNALMAAVYMRENNGTIIQLLLDRGADINAQSTKNQTLCTSALNAAVSKYKRQVPIVRLLLDRGADVNAPCGVYANTLEAALCGHSEDEGENEAVVRMLLEKGVDVNAKGDPYHNVLWTAKRRGFQKIEQLLLDSGAVALDPSAYPPPRWPTWA